MKLVGEKVDKQRFFSVGYDELNQCYLLSIAITYVGCFNRYYIITQEEYNWFENDHGRLIALMQECFDQNIHHTRFFFSEFDADNTEEQENIKWNYFRRDSAQ